MNMDNSFMNELFRIINGALHLDIQKVRNYTAFLAEKLEKNGDTSTANHLRRLLSENNNILKPTEVGFKPALPVDSESRFALVEEIDLNRRTEPPIVLDDQQWRLVHEFLSIAKSSALFESSSFR